MQNQPYNLSEFADSVLSAAGFAQLPDAAQEEFKQQIIAEATERIGLMALGELPEDQLKEYERLATTSKDPANDSAVNKFIVNAIPDFEKKVVLTLKAYALEFIEEAQKARQGNS
ncbi:hypothetical protein BK004_04410 [bacterium CG10_46_32]|nr:MAG: hypothetical protein BK004_04410 [bacterium CG10_46_32]PIR55752.1 MAG: hypothetical protein COU73_04450 [Parcubacteria group bacterium CG10_big_fil_rev_8_21_14_0_10_46_32]